MNLKRLKELMDTPPWEWPPDMGKQLLALLKNKKAGEAERQLASEMAGDMTVVNDDIAREFMRIIADPTENEKLRAQSAIALGPAMDTAWTDGFDDPYDLEEGGITEDVYKDLKNKLEKAYRDTSFPKLVRRRVLEAAVRAPEDWQSGAIREAYASNDPDWKLTAVFGMQYVQSFRAEILDALKSTDEDIYYEAVKAAGAREVDEAWQEIRDLAMSPNTEKELRIAAIGSMAQIRAAEARPLLYQLAEDPDNDISEAADEAVLLSGEPHDFDELAADDDWSEEELKPAKEWIN